MNIIHIEPNLTDEEKKRKRQEASLLFINIYEKHQQNKQAKAKQAGERVLE